MKTSRIMAVAVLFVGSGLVLHVALSQQPEIKRTDLQPHDLSVPGREVVQVLGEVLFIPYGKIHAARSVGNSKGAELATYIVEKGKPLVVPAK